MTSRLRTAARSRWVIGILIVALLYYGGASLGLRLAFEKTNASPVWPSSGIALAAVLLLGYRVWPGIMLGAFLANVVGFLANQAASALTVVAVSLAISVGNTLEALVGAFLLHRLVGTRNPFYRAQDGFWFTAVALLACVVSPSVGTTSVSLAGIGPPAVYGTIWFTWWLGDTIGMLLVTPLLLTWGDAPEMRWSVKRHVEAGLLLASLLVASWAGFGGRLPGTEAQYPLAFIPIPWLVWAAFRFGPRGAASAAVVTSVIAIWDTAHGAGPFVRATANESLLLLQAFVGTVTVTILTMAAAVAERRDTEARLRTAHDSLESRVEARTQELVHVNERLRGEVTERQRAEAVSRQSEASFRLLFANNPQPMWVYDLETLRFLEVNEAAVAHYGYSRDEFLSMRITDIRPPEDLSRLLENLAGERPTLQGSSPWRHRLRDGRIIDVDISSHTLDFAGRRAALVVAADITQRHQAEAALRQSEEQFRGAFDHSGIGMALQRTDGRYLRVNRALCEMLGYAEDELLATTYRALTPPEEIAADLEEDRRMLSGEYVFYQREKRYVHRRGHVVWVLVGVSLVRDARGHPAYFLVQSQDVSQRKALEAQLRQTQKVEAIGKLAGGVAHDFNNLLTVIIGRCQLVLGRLEPNSPLRRHVNLIDQTAVRAGRLTRQLLAFSRKQILQPTVLELDVLVGAMTEMFRRLIGEDIELITVPGQALGHVQADPAQLEQVILNLVVNARDAMPRGGRLILETANVELDETYARRHVGARPGSYVMLAVTDTGVGMDAATQSHLFEPFFTTKGPGQGTGLGLATVYGIVKQSGGSVWVYSELGRGTTVKVYLPRVPDAVSPRAPAPAAAEPPRGRETVLLVEDDESVRNLAREILEARGYTVLEAGHGADALLRGEGHPGLIHLLVTDVVMPAMSGRELAERLTAVRPAMRVLYMSGYTDDAIVNQGVLEPGMALLQKPFTPDALAWKVREVLDASRGDSA